MTTDILLDVNQKDFLYGDSNASKTFFSAEYGQHQIGGDTNSYLDVIIPSGYTVTPETQDVYIKAPYIPVNSPIAVRFLRKSGNTYTIISVFGSNSLPLKLFDNDGEKVSAYGCQLLSMDINGLLVLHCVSSTEGCNVSQALEGDFRIGNADKQAAELMMVCRPGKNYRYPISGVGASQFLGSIIDRTAAAGDILRELGGDSQGVKDVYYDSASKKMRITTDEYNNKQQITLIDTSTLDVSAFENDEE